MNRQLVWLILTHRRTATHNLSSVTIGIAVIRINFDRPFKEHSWLEAVESLPALYCSVDFIFLTDSILEL